MAQKLVCLLIGPGTLPGQGVDRMDMLRYAEWKSGRPPLKGEELLAALPEIASVARVEVDAGNPYGIANLDNLRTLALRIEALTRRPDVAGVVFVHHRPAEEKFLSEGFGVRRHDVMYNDFVVIGPKADPAHIAGGKDVADALRKIAETRAGFVSRGDRSGTHEAELRLWKEAGIDLAAVKGDWYREIGQGMGAALNMASSANAYLLSDRGTWLAFKNRGELAVLTEGDRLLFNQYGVMLVNPARHAGVKAADGQAFIDWLVSPLGQQTIADYKVGGERLFFPNASD